MEQEPNLETLTPLEKLRDNLDTSLDLGAVLSENSLCFSLQSTDMRVEEVKSMLESNYEIEIIERDPQDIEERGLFKVLDFKVQVK